MKRGLGAAGIGAAALAGAMFHATMSRDGGANAPKPQPTAAQSTAAGDGPWLASCSYWSSARWKEPPPQKSSEVIAPANQPAAGADSLAATSTEKTGCAVDDWGIPLPELVDHHQPDIRAIIATVPDPIHSHLALEFDRTIDAFLQAAADNRFLESQYWLPWKSRIAPPSAGDTSTIPPETAEDLKREQQPGLIILKYGPRTDAHEDDATWSGYHRVIYLFLVGETPALGMNGTQLRNALRYEAMLAKNYQVRLSMGEENRLSIIGPFSSGSAASLREGLENAKFDRDPSEIIIAGGTSTGIASSELNSREQGQQKITYVSFAENTDFELSQFFHSLNRSSSDLRRIAILAEEDTVFGAVNPSTTRLGGIVIRFPREISLLRNAQTKSAGESSATPTPYLNLSLKDSDADDTVPHFSTAQTPLSQEAELMAIARQLQRNRTQYILIAGSDILDEIFLAQFLRRACPDARLVFYNGGDLLIERDVDNVPYIGSIVLTPYTLIDLDNSSGAGRAFSDAHAERAYNAASYIFWYGTSTPGHRVRPTFAGYQRTADNTLQIPLWATTIGGDGYYPLGIINPCASDTHAILPSIVESSLRTCWPTDVQVTPILSAASPNAAPSLFWFVLCTLIASMCIGHTTVMLSAEYWSAFTRDLAVRQNDQPRRRSVYINIGTSVLFSMAFVVSFPLFAMLFPLFSIHRFYLVDTPSFTAATITLVSGFVALRATLSRTLPHSGRASGINPESTTRLYSWFNLVALITVIIVPLLWMWLCLRTTVSGTASYVGTFFSYRSLHPTSGVSPVIPILLLLFSWYLWSVFQTARLRFSTMSRPRLPDNVESKSPYPLYVSDTALTQCKTPIDSCLIENVTCLLITRETVRRFTGWSAKKLNTILIIIYLVLFVICIFWGHIQSLERFLLHPRSFPTAYEFLIAALFFPLIMVALTGWLRMIFIWGSLSRGLLEPLERTPLRLAFTRLKDVGWMTMLSQSSLHIRWRDMARSIESLRQLVNNPDLAQAIGNGDHWKDLSDTYDDLIEQITELRKRITIRTPPKPEPKPPAFPPGDDDLPEEEHRYDLGYIYQIEMLYAKFCEYLLAYLLIPYWNEKRVGFVEEGEEGEHPGSDGSKSISDPDAPEDPVHIRLAEELLTIRYVALIRAVLVNTRYLMLFVSTAFVFAIIAWNSYPFQPRQLIDWCFTLLMIFLGCGFIWVFAQMHRNAILSRITDTKPNELGRDFYIRIATFGAIPVLTWFAYQFPEVGGSLLRILQPGLQVIK